MLKSQLYARKPKISTSSNINIQMFDLAMVRGEES